MEPIVKTGKVGKEEAFVRIVIGAILVLSTFFIQGILSWIIGLIGVAFIVTALFGY
jgi:hypothetical protein